MVNSVILGEQLVHTWYTSTYPAGEHVSDEKTLETDRLFVCPHCLKYTLEGGKALAHMRFCDHQYRPLGRQFYAHEQYSIFEIDGRKEKLFCQCLCLLAKLFLETKSVHYDVEGFLFYVLVQISPIDSKSRIVGFFSKEKTSWENYNLACILIFPPYQKLGLGKLLIAFSYELSKQEEKVGSPEKPLSDLGRKGYMAYWTTIISNKILASPPNSSLTVEDLTTDTCIHPDDIVDALKYMNAIQRNPSTGEISISQRQVRGWAQANRVSISDDSIIQSNSITPYPMSRSRSGSRSSTVSADEEDEDFEETDNDEEVGL